MKGHIKMYKEKINNDELAEKIDLLQDELAGVLAWATHTKDSVPFDRKNYE
jgi:hypothetical protein